MKTPRIFILIGACAIVSTISLNALESTMRPCWADPLPILRADPWAGDPDEPGLSKRISLDEEEDYSRISVPYEPTSASNGMRSGLRLHVWWAQIRGSSFMLLLLGGRR